MSVTLVHRVSRAASKCEEEVSTVMMERDVWNNYEVKSWILIRFLSKLTCNNRGLIRIGRTREFSGFSLSFIVISQSLITEEWNKNSFEAPINSTFLTLQFFAWIWAIHWAYQSAEVMNLFIFGFDLLSSVTLYSVPKQSETIWFDFDFNCWNLILLTFWIVNAQINTQISNGRWIRGESSHPGSDIQLQSFFKVFYQSFHIFWI